MYSQLEGRIQVTTLLHCGHIRQFTRKLISLHERSSPVPGPSAHLQPPVRPQKPTQATHAKAHEYVGGQVSIRRNAATRQFFPKHTVRH